MTLVSRSVLEALIPTYPLLATDVRDRVVTDVSVFVDAEIRGAPAHIRAGIWVLALTFRLWMVLSAGRPLGSLPLAIDRWETLTGGPGRSFIRLVRSLSALAFLEHPAVIHALGLTQVPDRQTRFRALRNDAMAEAEA